MIKKRLMINISKNIFVNSKLRGIFISTFLLLFPMISFAQEQAVSLEQKLDNSMRQDGKIYVVIVVVALVFLGLLFYVINLDKKITRLENEVGNAGND